VKKEAVLAQLIEAVFKSKNHIIKGNNVQSETGGSEQFIIK
jgi:hypothetical protein